MKKVLKSGWTWFVLGALVCFSLIGLLLKTAYDFDKSHTPVSKEDVIRFHNQARQPVPITEATAETSTDSIIVVSEEQIPLLRDNAALRVIETKALAKSDMLWIRITGVPKSAKRVESEPFALLPSMLMGYKIEFRNSQGAGLWAVSGEAALREPRRLGSTEQTNTEFFTKFETLYQACKDSVFDRQPVILEGIYCARCESGVLLPRRVTKAGQTYDFILEPDVYGPFGPFIM